MTVQLVETSSSMSVSDYEENIWMLQLQQPEKITQQLYMWKLPQGTDLVFLSKIIQELVETKPNLNVRYQFGDEGDLNKYSSKDWATCLKHKEIKSENIFEQLEILKKQTWCAETHPPFTTYIFETQQDVFLVLALHPILNQLYQKSDFIQAIKTTYQQYSKNNIDLLLTEISLPDESSASITENTELPDKNHIAHIILQEFRNTLAEPEMTLNDDFFDFGGHSLLATRVIGNLLNKHGIEIGFNNFFKAPNASGLAEYAEVKHLDTPQSILENVEKAPLTLAQDFLWQAYTAFDFSPIYNLPFAIEFLDEVNEDIFFQAFTDLVERHASLRTMFKNENGRIYQYSIAISSLHQYKWFWNSFESKNTSLSNEASYQFDLTRELPIRIRFIRNDQGQQILSFLVHHMVIDEWSLNTIMADLSHAYFARSQARAPVWKSSAQTIYDYSLLQQKQGINQDHLNYWTQMLRGATKGLHLSSLDHAHSQDSTPQVKWVELKFPSDLYNKLTAFSRCQGTSLFAIVYTAIADALHQQGQLEELVIGTSAAARTDPNFFDTVGYFTTMVAHRIQFDKSTSFKNLLQNVSTLINDSMAYADIPINHIQKALGMTDHEGLIFDVYIHIHSNNALNGVLKQPEGQYIRYHQILPERNESMFGLHFEIMDNIIDDKPQFSMIITYQAHRYPTSIIENICDQILSTLQQI